jgi:hypothetical protein
MIHVPVFSFCERGSVAGVQTSFAGRLFGNDFQKQQQHQSKE